jgi:hypothetical protein
VLETQKEDQLLDNIMKCEFFEQYLVYLGRVIGEGELKIDHENMEAIMKWPFPTNVIEGKIFIGEK